jgi:hypothetical protein
MLQQLPATLKTHGGNCSTGVKRGLETLIAACAGLPGVCHFRTPKQLVSCAELPTAPLHMPQLPSAASHIRALAANAVLACNAGSATHSR